MSSLVCERIKFLCWILCYYKEHLFIVRVFTLFLVEASKTVAPSMSAVPLPSLYKYEYK